MAELTWDDVVQLISGTGPAHLATADADGTPHVSTVGAVADDDRLWLITRRTSGKGANLLLNPRVAFMWSGNNAETYVWGDAELIDDPAIRERLWTGNVFPYDPQGFFGDFDSPDTLVVKVTPTRATAMVQGENGLERKRWHRAG